MGKTTRDMKRSDTIFRHKANLLYETGASIREMVNAITSKIGTPVIDFRLFADLGVCERVGTWIMDNDGETGVWGLFTLVERNAGSKDIHLIAEADCDYERDDEMYGYSLDELIYLHDEIEKIHRFVSRKGFSARDLQVREV
jgi:hypothetical protein